MYYQYCMNSLKITSPDFSLLKDITYKLWERVKQEMFQSLDVEEKFGQELVTRVDRLIEKLAREMIKEKLGNVNFKGEEFPDEDNGSEITCIIDPLDGTESFINREFNTSISIWIEQSWILVYWIVYDFMKGMLYEWGENSSLFIDKKTLPLLRKNYSNQTRVLLSGRWEDLTNLEKKLKSYPHLRITRAYGSVAMQIVQTWAGNYDGYIRAWKVKPWDIAGWIPFIQWLDDTELFSREWNDLNYKAPDTWLIVVRDSFKKELFEILDL